MTPAASPITELAGRLATLEIAIIPGTLLFPLGEVVSRMATAYQADGAFFERSGDHMNALAAWSYALGWMDAGCCLGLVRAGAPRRGWFFGNLECPGPEDRVEEKVSRYRRLLADACTAAHPAADPESALFPAGLRLIMVARVHLSWGTAFISSGRMGNALASYSYGHAWLDAGMRCGLLSAENSRHIFTI